MSKKEKAKGVPCACGALLVNLPAGSGAVCPKGCGTIQPRLSDEDNGAGLRRLRLERLPVCAALATVRATEPVKFMGRLVYRVDGERGCLWRRVKRAGSGLAKASVEGAVLCWWKAADKPVELVQFAALNTEMLAAGLCPVPEAKAAAPAVPTEGPDDAE